MLRSQGVQHLQQWRVWGDLEGFPLLHSHRGHAHPALSNQSKPLFVATVLGLVPVSAMRRSPQVADQDMPGLFAASVEAEPVNQAPWPRSYTSPLAVPSTNLRGLEPNAGGGRLSHVRIRLQVLALRGHDPQKPRAYEAWLGCAVRPGGKMRQGQQHVEGWSGTGPTQGHG